MKTWRGGSVRCGLMLETQATESNEDDSGQKRYGCRSATDTSMYRSLWEKHDVLRDLDGTFVGAG